MLFLRTPHKCLIKTAAKAEAFFPDVSGGNDTHRRDSKIILLTSCMPTVSPEDMGCKRQNIYLYHFHQQGMPEFKVYY